MPHPASEPAAAHPAVLRGRTAPLPLVLARGALAGIGKHPSPGAGAPARALTLPGVRIDPRRAAAYAEVCGHPAGPVPPLTYPHVLGFPLAARLMGARDFPLPLLGLVHTSIGITATRVPRGADRPDLTVRLAGLRPHRRGTEAVLVTEAALDGETVWSDTSTYLARHPVPDARTPGTPDPDAPGPNSQARATAPPERPDPLPERARWTLPASLGRRHAAVSGDWNPIHLHAWTARPFGFRRPIAHGMWTVARCLAEAPDALEARAEFRAPVALPGTVVYAADGTGAFEVRAASGARTHLTGWAGSPR
jgi:acyl dehydratase